MSPEDRNSADQQFGAEAAKDQQRADDAAGTSAEQAVAADVADKEPRAGNKAEPDGDE